MATATTNSAGTANPTPSPNDGVFQHLLVPFVLQDPAAGAPVFDNIDDLAATKRKAQDRLQSLNFSQALIDNVLNGPLFAPASSANLLGSMQTMSAVSLYNDYGVHSCGDLVKNVVAYCLNQESRLPDPATQNPDVNAGLAATAPQGS